MLSKLELSLSLLMVVFKFMFYFDLLHCQFLLFVDLGLIFPLNLL